MSVKLKIEISDNDVDEINKLQILNCNNNIFFENCSQSYVENLFHEVENDISQNNDIILKKSSDINEKKLNEFLSELSAFDIAEGVLFTSFSIKKEMNFSFIEGINPPASKKFSRDKQAVKFFEITVNADFYESMVENNKIKELQEVPKINISDNKLKFKIYPINGIRKPFIFAPKSLEKEDLKNLIIRGELIPFRNGNTLDVQLKLQIRKRLKKSEKLLLEANLLFSDMHEFVMLVTLGFEVYFGFGEGLKPKFSFNLGKSIVNFDIIACYYVVKYNLYENYF